MESRNLSGKRIKLVRIAQDMKQTEVRAALSVDFGIELSQAALSDIERGKRSVSDIELDAFAKTFSIHPVWLMYGDNAPDFKNKRLESR